MPPTRSSRLSSTTTTTSRKDTATFASTRLAAAMKDDNVVAEFTVTGTTLTSHGNTSHDDIVSGNNNNINNNNNSISGTGGCLHCHKSEGSIQVSCDECHSYICINCHWCHEYQANHEIRVCDRCDAFRCRACDEMDQCEDCSEVVCSSCSTLLSCKFCGCGLCEECATACGRCGIVLCARDAKFAVECDTCKLSYCLVCLASGTKDPCVRCGQRPSKRVEQLVHLRLKSIYKAFKQSGASEEEEDVGAVLQAAAAAAAASTSNRCKKDRSTINKEKFKVKQQQADAAAAALLAELEEEEIAADQASKTKKSKKKRRKERQQAKMEEKKRQQKLKQAEKEETTIVEEEDEQEEEEQPKSESENEEEEEEKVETILPSEPEEPEVDQEEKKLLEMIDAGDMEGIESLLAQLKGVPGRGPLRKNAKKALKRLREQAAPAEEPVAVEVPQAEVKQQEQQQPPPQPIVEESSYKPPEPLLKLVSHSHRPNVGNNGQGGGNNTNGKRPSVQSSSSSSRAECIMQMAPTVVGWVIGKGGQRIRDLMEESSAKVWIDQDSMASNEPRMVYVSGNRKSVDAAVRMIKDLVAKAPVGGAGSPQMAASAPTDDLNTDKLPSPVKPQPPAAKEEPPPPPPPKNAPPRRSESSDYVVEELDCEARFVPLLIGRRGWTIKHIQDSSGARVDIDQTKTPRKVKISGKASCVKVAKKLVSDVLSYPHAQLHYHGHNASSRSTDNINKSPDSPPATSLNIQSTMSASSSLSSTPEPSVVEHVTTPIGTTVPVPAAPLLAPGLLSNDNSLPMTTTPTPIGATAASQPLMTTTTTTAPPAEATTSLYEQQAPPFLANSSFPVETQRTNAVQQLVRSNNPGTIGGAIGQTRQMHPTAIGQEQKTSMLGQAQGSDPFLNDRQGFGHHSSSHPLFHRHASAPMPQQHSLGGLNFSDATNGGTTSSSSFGLWGDQPQATNHVEPERHAFNRASSEVGVNNSQAHLGFGYTEPAASSSTPLFSQVNTNGSGLFGKPIQNHGGGGEESHMVDNLFGPPSGGGQSLLSGLQGLALEQHQGGVGDDDEWGSAIPGWGTNGQQQQQQLQTQQQGNGMFGKQMHGQHPSQSRLQW